MAAVADDELSVSELDAEISELVHVGQMVDVLMSRKTKALCDRDSHYELGYSSPTAYLCDRGGMSPWHAKQVISRANAREKAPYAYQAWSDGGISTDQARWLFAAAEAVPDAYPEAEQTLVDAMTSVAAIGGHT
ncbi:MAG TPA: hypothetical protein VE569_00215 [Acidimicrobiia bacterium]|jgi:hypothetical protein|nr:hypothetical protein [Acidimicrobiia bacterium]